MEENDSHVCFDSGDSDGVYIPLLIEFHWPPHDRAYTDWYMTK